MATTDFTRTPSSGGNRKTWTFSAWLKRASKSDSNNSRILSAGGAQTDYTSWFMHAADGTDAALQLQNRISNTTTTLKTNRKFRDVNSWYHLVIACDTTQATASNRIKIYINGVQETSFATEEYPAQNADTFVNHTVGHNIGSSDDAGYTPRYWAGSMSHVALVDGQQLTPTSFGETDSTSGIWKFKQPSGITWGTNGFHLKFENSGNMGLDSSGQTNNFTISGGTPTQSLDTPSNVYATFNSLINPNGATLANGNTHSSKSSAHATVQSTIPCGYPNAPSTAKFYWECKMEAVDGRTVGLVKSNMPQISSRYNDYLGQNSGGDGVIGYYLGTYADGTQADVAWNGTAPQVTISGGWSAGDILVNAYDASTGKYWQGKNGVWFTVGGGVGNPATGAYPLVTLNATDRTHDIFPADSSYDGRWSWNFGNGYFKTTAITSAGSNGNGSLFEYDVPSGYYALNTKNINTYG